MLVLCLHRIPRHVGSMELMYATHFQKVRSYLESLAGEKSGMIQAILAGRWAKVVSELKSTSGAIFLCELCGFGYGDLETAERCGQYCYTHGRTSTALAGKAVHKPRGRVIPAD